jgi:hypothetical protein
MKKICSKTPEEVVNCEHWTPFLEELKEICKSSPTVIHDLQEKMNLWSKVHPMAAAEVFVHLIVPMLENDSSLASLWVL